MTSKEKADELYVGYWYLTNDSRIAKQCALIAVDEIIENGIKWMPEIKWWMQVKKEISNL